MDGDNKSCEACSQLKVLLNEKNCEIERLELQIKNLKTFLRAYEKQAKLCQFCTIKDSECNIYEECDTYSEQIQSVLCFKESLDTALSDALENADLSVETVNSTENMNLTTLDYNVTCEDKISPVKSSAGESCLSTSQSVPEVQNSEDYIYDENLKMYYCPSTGYYYDHKSGFFYHTQTRAYYSYNYAKSEYELCKEPTSKELVKEDCDSVLDKVNGLNISDCEPNSPTKAHNDGKLNPFQHTDDSCENTECLKNETFCGSTSDWQPVEGSNTTIEDLVRSVVDQSSGMSDYIYDEETKMYCSKSTGYFYDPVRKLLYDPQSKIYYQYIEETMSYEFYCKADAASSMYLFPKQDPLKASCRKKPKKQWRKKISSLEPDPLLNNKNLHVPEENKIDSDQSVESPEEGEIFSTDSDSDTELSRESTPSLGPPCIRAIVKKSEKLKVGTLILITCTGAIIGRDKVNTVYMPDIGVSKVHSEIKFNNDIWKYTIEDLGSQNGTSVNDVRLSEPKKKSEPLTLNHGDILTLGSCELLLHIHEGHDTCDKCEPGQVLAEILSQEALAKPVTIFKTKEEKEKERRLELSRMKKKYGLKGMEYVTPKQSVMTGSGYEDKAEMRRKTVGSQNPYEKTETASMEEGISKSNKGFQMLKKLGWKEGDSLGLKGSGISEPIPLRPWLSKAGLGSSEQEASRQPLPNNSRQQKWVKAQERYLKLT